MLLLGLVSTICRAQNVAGFWMGVTYPDDPSKAVFNYAMTLTQTGNTIGGTAQTSNPNVPFGGVAQLSGQVGPAAVTFSESNKNGSTTVEDVCYWRGSLTYNATDESLIGTYQPIVNGTTCKDKTSGKVELYRIVLKSGNSFCKGTPVDLVVTGKNVRWYSGDSQSKLLATGNQFSPTITKTTTYYITQTLYNTESPAVPITIDIREPIFKTTVTNVGCGKPSGSIDVIATNATNWHYSLNGGPFQSSPSFLNISPGSYTVTVQDAAGCQADQPVKIVSGDAPTIANISVTPPHCATANGELSVQAAGGTPPLTYSIDYGVTFQSSSVFKQLPASDYTVRVHDANGCEVNKVASLPAPTLLVLAAVDITPTTCGQTNGRVTITGANGKRPIQYSIDNQSFQISNVFDSLTAGTHTLVATDSIGCIVRQAISVGASTGPVLTDVQVTPEACGERNGGLRVSPLADNTSLSIDGQLFQQATDYANLQAGTYPVTVKDANNCLVTKLVLVPSDCPSQLHLPTAFSPNADQSNDALTVYFRFPSISVARFTVFDRWGAVIHNRTNFVLSNGDSLWDGQLNGNTAPAGTYLYQLDCQFPNGVQTILHQSVSLLH